MELLIIFFVIGIPLTIIWYIWIMVRDIFHVINAIVKRKKADYEVKDRLRENSKSILFAGIFMLIILGIIFVLGEIDSEFWMILFGVVFLFLFIFSTIGTLFIGEIPFIGAATESKFGCLLSIIIFVVILLGISYALYSS